MLTALAVGIVLGLVGGFYFGRWCSEVARARHDIRQVWQGRRRYRG